MAYTPIGVPDLGIDALKEVYQKEQEDLSKGTQTLSNLISIRDEAMANIPSDLDPALQEQIEAKAKSLDTKINQYTELLKRNPREFSHVTQGLSNIGLDALQTFGPAGIIGKTNAAVQAWDKGLEAATNSGFTQEQYEAFNPKNAFISAKLANESTSIKSPVAKFDYTNAITKALKLQNPLRETITSLGDGKFQVEETREIINLSPSEIQTIIESSGEYQQYLKYVEGVQGYGEKRLFAGTNKLGEELFYTVDDNGYIVETTDPNKAISRPNLDMYMALQATSPLLTSHTISRNIKPSTIKGDNKNKDIMMTSSELGKETLRTVDNITENVNMPFSIGNRNFQDFNEAKAFLDSERSKGIIDDYEYNQFLTSLENTKLNKEYHKAVFSKLETSVESNIEKSPYAYNLNESDIRFVAKIFNRDVKDKKSMISKANELLNEHNSDYNDLEVLNTFVIKNGSDLEENISNLIGSEERPIKFTLTSDGVIIKLADGTTHKGNIRDRQSISDYIMQTGSPKDREAIQLLTDPVTNKLVEMIHTTIPPIKRQSIPYTQIINGHRITMIKTKYGRIDILIDNESMETNIDPKNINDILLGVRQRITEN